MKPTYFITTDIQMTMPKFTSQILLLFSKVLLTKYFSGHDHSKHSNFQQLCGMTYYGKLPLTSFQTCEKINNIYYYIALFYVVVEVFK